MRPNSLLIIHNKIMFSAETNIDTDIDIYTNVSDLVKHVNYYNFTVFKIFENILKVIKPHVNDFQKCFTT